MCKEVKENSRKPNSIKFAVCLFWGVLNLIFGVALILFALIYTEIYELSGLVALVGCCSGTCYVASGLLLTIGLFKGAKNLVGTSIIFSSIGVLFIHWLIVPLVLYFIFSLAVFHYYQVEMAD